MQSYICSRTSHSCRQYGLTECIKQAMNFPEHFSVIIDLILVLSPHFVYTGVSDSFLVQNIWYHCPVYAIVKPLNLKPKHTSLYIWLFDQRNHEDLRGSVSTDWNSLCTSDINISVANFTNCLFDVCKQFIPTQNMGIKHYLTYWVKSTY